MSVTITGLDQAATLSAGEGRAESSLRRLSIGGQRFFVLKQRGRFADIAYDHGRLLAREIEAGAFPEIVATIARGVNLESGTLAKVAAAIYRSYSDRVLRHCSDEFRAAVDGLAAGYRAGIGAPKFSDLEVRDALIAIEVGNIVDGLSRVFALPGVRAARAPGILALVVSGLRDPDAKIYLESAQQDTAKQRDVGVALQAMAGPNNRIDFACTGFAVPAVLAAGGLHLHARNLDADLYNWNTAPVLSLIDETEGKPGWHRYTAFGTAASTMPASRFRCISCRPRRSRAGSCSPRGTSRPSSSNGCCARPAASTMPSTWRSPPGISPPGPSSSPRPRRAKPAASR
jgi:hypothetical protein